MGKAFMAMMVTFTGVAIALITSIAVCVYGWGLEPKSWGWIIGMNQLGSFLASLFAQASKMMINRGA